MNYSNFKSLACVLANTINKKQRERYCRREDEIRLLNILCIHIFRTYENDKFQFYVSVENPSKVEQSFNLYFLFKSKEKQKERLKIVSKTLSRKKVLALE